MKSYPANEWGLYEMHGNVWEWCQDVWQITLGSKLVIDPEQQAEDEQANVLRVMRGGSLVNSARNCRSAARGRGEPDSGDFFIGFRLSLCHELQPDAGGTVSGASGKNKERAVSTALGSIVTEQPTKDPDIQRWADELGITYAQMEELDVLERNIIDEGKFGEYLIIGFADFDPVENPELQEIMDEIGADEWRQVRIDAPSLYFSEPDYDE